MTAEPTGSSPGPETEGLPGRKLFRIYVVTVLIGLAGVAVSAWLLDRGRSAHAQYDRRGPGGERTTPRTIGILEQTAIEQTAAGLTLNAEKRRAIERYGWVDRPAGIARIPIDRAIDVVAGDPKRR